MHAARRPWSWLIFDVRQKMKLSAVLSLVWLSCAPLQAWVVILDTPSFRIEIEHACEEGCVSCDRIRYRGTSKKTQQSIALTGSSVHTTADDGKTPSRFLGYRFVNGSTVYFVGDDGRLEVTQRTTRLLSEQGVWDDDQKSRTSRQSQRSPSVLFRS
jgi:hypothetical protein